MEYTDDFLRKILQRTKTVAVVGVSANQIRPSFYVARYLGDGILVPPLGDGTTSNGDRSGPMSEVRTPHPRRPCPSRPLPLP